MTTEEMDELQRAWVERLGTTEGWAMSPLELAAAAYEDATGRTPLRTEWSADKAILIQERPDTAEIAITIQPVPLR